MKTEEDYDHKNNKRKFHDKYFNELVMIAVVGGVLIFGSLWIVLVNYKVKNIEKKR